MTLNAHDLGEGGTQIVRIYSIALLLRFVNPNSYYQ